MSSEKIKVCLDYKKYTSKPSFKDIGKINNRISEKMTEITIEELANCVGNKGQTFTPAIFDGARNINNVKEIQLIALDFDNKEDKIVSFRDVVERSERLGLDIAFAYETFSSRNCSKFRIVFKYFEPIINKDFFKIIMNIFLEIFPEADRATKDSSRIFFGGKGLLLEPKNNSVFPNRLFASLYMYLSANAKTKVEKIKIFAMQNNIYIERNTFKLDCIKYKDEKNLESTVIYNKKEKFFPDENIFIIYRKDNTKVQKEMRQEYKKIKGIKPTFIEEKCQLLYEFRNGERWLYYNEIWGILTNIVYINGGPKYFKNIIDSLPSIAPNEFSYNYEKWYSNLEQIKKSPYGPSRCDDFCPYAKQCTHSKNILTTAYTKKSEISVLNTDTYVNIEDARKELLDTIKYSINSNDDDIHLINAPTGIGKTYSYIQAIKQNKNCKFIIAVPTNALKNEILERMEKEGIIAMSTPSLPEDIDKNDRKILESYANKGSWTNYRLFLEKLSNKYKSIKQFKKNLKKSLNYQGNIVTTHIRFLFMFSEDKIANRTVIIDEDIMKSLFNTDCIDNNTIEYIKNIQYLDKCSKDRIKYYTKNNDKNLNRYNKHLRENKIELSEEIRKKLADDKNIQFDLSNLINADATMTTERGLYFAWKRELPKAKIIILSATASEQVYAKFFKNTHIKYTKIAEVKYKGQIIQYYSESYSRKWITKHKKDFEKIKEKHSNCNIITFMKYSNENSDELHFGNTEGKDGFSNKDLAIIGTPFYNEIVYKLLATVLDYEKDIINTDELATRLIKYENYEFYFFTYSDKFLQNLQIYYISSELEQSVGRARLLNNENTVYVYSSFPVKQANFVKGETV